MDLFVFFARYLPSFSFPLTFSGSRLMSGLCMTNTLLLPLVVYVCFSSMLSPVSIKKFRLWSEKVFHRTTQHWLVLVQGETSKVPVVECSSVLKQGRERKQGCTWSSPVRRKSWWRVPVAMDKVLEKKSKMIDKYLSLKLLVCPESLTEHIVNPKKKKA